MNNSWPNNLSRHDKVSRGWALNQIKHLPFEFLIYIRNSNLAWLVFLLCLYLIFLSHFSPLSGLQRDTPYLQNVFELFNKLACRVLSGQKTTRLRLMVLNLMKHSSSFIKQNIIEYQVFMSQSINESWVNELVQLPLTHKMKAEISESA